MEHSAVNDFLDKAEEQEKTELEMLADKDRASIKAAHKGLMPKVDDQETLLDNPISRMTLMRNPDLIKKAQGEDLEAMARGEDALVETSLELRCSDNDLKIE